MESSSCRAKSSERYWRGWKRRSLRTCSVETRLAVKLAMQPELNSSLAFAMSTLEREHGEADGADFANASGAKAEDDVEVVDHEIQDHVYVERARREDAEPMSLEEHGPCEARGAGGDGGVEPLEVPDGDEAAAG